MRPARTEEAISWSGRSEEIFGKESSDSEEREGFFRSREKSSTRSRGSTSRQEASRRQHSLWVRRSQGDRSSAPEAGGFGSEQVVRDEEKVGTTARTAGTSKKSAGAWHAATGFKSILQTFPGKDSNPLIFKTKTHFPF